MRKKVEERRREESEEGEGRKMIREKEGKKRKMDRKVRIFMLKKKARNTGSWRLMCS